MKSDYIKTVAIGLAIGALLTVKWQFCAGSLFCTVALL